MNPRVSAIVPTFRRPQELLRALQSVLAQNWRPLELVVVDDGSGDETLRVMHDFAAHAQQADVAYHCLSVKNGGPGLARNAGMDAATGEFFAFLDDDDEWRPEKLKLQVPALLARPHAGLCFSRYVHDSAMNTPKPSLESMIDGWCFESLCDGRTRAYMPTLLVRRQVRERVGGFAPLYNFEDSEFCLRAALDFEFVALDAPLTIVHAAQVSVSRDQGLEGDLERDALKLRVLQEFAVNHDAHPRFSASALQKFRARVYDEHIKHLLWLGRVDQARQAWRRALVECGEQSQLRKLAGKLRKAWWLGLLGLRLGRS